MHSLLSQLQRNLFTFSCQDSNDLNVCQNRGKDGLRNSLEAQNGQRSAAASFVAKLFTPYFSADLRAQFHLRFKIKIQNLEFYKTIYILFRDGGENITTGNCTIFHLIRNSRWKQAGKKRGYFESSEKLRSFR